MEKYVMRFYMTTARSKKTEALELNAIHQRLSYADDVNLLFENMNIIKTQILLDATDSWSNNAIARLSCHLSVCLKCLHHLLRKRSLSSRLLCRAL
jgi:hypothetical protein